MTRKELADFLGYETLCSVSTAVTKAKKIMPSIKLKDKRDPYALVSFTKEEILCIASQLNPPLNEIQMTLLSENYIEHDKTYIQKRQIYIDGTEKFLKRYAKDRRHMKVCACCAYCVGKSRAGKTSKLFPFCSFYDKFISYMTIEKRGKTVRPNIFVDGCETFLRAEAPRMFLK